MMLVREILARDTWEEKRGEKFWDERWNANGLCGSKTREAGAAEEDSYKGLHSWK